MIWKPKGTKTQFKMQIGMEVTKGVINRKGVLNVNNLGSTSSTKSSKKILNSKQINVIF